MRNEERIIEANPGRVWALVSDVERWGEMLPTMQRVTRIGPQGPTGVGSRFEVRQPGVPKAVYEITAWEPGAGFTWAAASPGVRTTATHSVTPYDGGSRLVLGIEWSGPLARVVRLLLASKVARMVVQEADTFARLAEQDAKSA